MVPARAQFGTLAERELAMLLGSPGTLLMFLAQPLMVGAVLGLAWRRAEATPSTFLCMAIAAVYLGCMNAAGAIVRERAVLRRERMVGLRIWPYLLSKTAVLAVVVAVQTGLLLWVQGSLMHLPPGVGNHLGMFLVLACAALAATGLGLAISALAGSTYVAVIAVPILIIPQIVFSRVVLGKVGIEKQIPALVEKLTITRWAYEALEALARDHGAWTVAQGVLVPLLQLGVLLGVAATRLWADDR